MKFLTSLSVAIATLALSSPVLAQASTKAVVVTATLGAACQFATGGTIDIGPVVYPAFSALAVTDTGTATVQCTRNTSGPTFTFDASTGIVSGLTYNLTAGYGTNDAGSDPTGTSSSIGVARTGVVTVTATFLAGQAGSSATTANTPNRVLTVAY